MSITFIKELEHVYPNRKFAIADLDDLVLDTFNPRFSSSTLIGSNSQATQEDIISCRNNITI